jgi:protein-L-isoaspartate(D-aspartate) O-methyltransferase
VILTGGIDTVTDTHKLQVLPGGQLFVLVGQSPVLQGQLHRLDHDNQWTHEFLFETDLPPLIDKLKPKEFIF